MTSAIVRLLRTAIDTPIGRVVLLGGEDRLQLLAFEDDWSRPEKTLARRFRTYEIVEGRVAGTSELDSYFAGDLDALDRIPLDPGGTPFQARVWKTLGRIPVGKTRTYGQVARSLRAPDASRAVGAANGANPIAIVIPCHRLIGSTGALTGYAFGVHRKRWLLRHEGVEI